MSVKLVDHIVDDHHIEIDPEMIKKVKVSCFVKLSISSVFLLTILAFFSWIFEFIIWNKLKKLVNLLNILTK
jgi:hypothetical protein